MAACARLRTRGVEPLGTAAGEDVILFHYFFFFFFFFILFFFFLPANDAGLERQSLPPLRFAPLAARLRLRPAVPVLVLVLVLVPAGLRVLRGGAHGQVRGQGPAGRSGRAPRVHSEPFHDRQPHRAHRTGLFQGPPQCHQSFPQQQQVRLYRSIYRDFTDPSTLNYNFKEVRVCVCLYFATLWKLLSIFF